MCSVSTIMSVVLKKKVLLAVPWILFSGQWTGSKDIHLALNLIKKEKVKEEVGGGKEREEI